MGIWMMTVITSVLGVVLLTLTGCRPVPWANEQAPEVSEGRSQVREAVASAPSQRSPMEMPDWYRELLRETSSPDEQQPVTVYEDVGTVRGFW